MFAWLQQRQYAILVIAALILFAGVAAERLWPDAPREIVFHPPAVADDGLPIRVYLTGGVRQPGVYQVRAGDRLIDAIALAGGATADADLEAANLARRLRDGEQVVVPQRQGSTPSISTFAGSGVVDINRATESQLDALPGIGEAYARRIVDSRKVDGPFRTTQELVERRVLPQSTYEGIRGLVTVASE